MEKAACELQEYDVHSADKLLDLCFEGRCSIELLLFHLDMSFNKPGVRDYIINYLFTVEESFILFYVPQVVYLALLSPLSSLEALVMNASSKSIESFILVYWTFSAWSHDIMKKRGPKKPLDKVLATLEENWIATSISQEMRQAKIDIWTLLKNFTTNLTSFSLYLKSKPEETRKRRLKTLIKILNNFLFSRRQNVIETLLDSQLRGFYTGLIIPFTFCENASANLIVGILPDEISCFETKKRCPYKVVLECVDKEELKHKRENAKKARIYNISEEEETEVKDFQSEEFKVKMRENSEVVSPAEKFKGLDTFASKMEREEIHLQVDTAAKLTVASKAFKQTAEKTRFSIRAHRQMAVSSLNNNCITKTKRDKENSGLASTSILGETGNKHFRKASVDCERFTPQKATRRIIFLEGLLTNISQTTRPIRSTIEEEIKTLKTRANPCAKNKMFPVSQNIIEEIAAKRIFKELWRDQVKKFRSRSSFGHFSSYSLRPLIVKGGDDLRQEVVAMQLMKKFKKIFAQERINCYVRPYEIVAISHTAGFLEFLTDTLPIDFVKKVYKVPLGEIFKQIYGETLEIARKNFIESLAGYSLFSYLMQIKDRHNGNIMLSHEGHIIHIDFGFLFSISPGGLNFENAPFKFTTEYLELLGGKDSDFFSYYRSIMVNGLLALQKHFYELISIVRIMCNQSFLPCFEKFVLPEFEDRFKIYFTEAETIAYVDRLISDSMGSNRTVWYDDFQKLTNKIEP